MSSHNKFAEIDAAWCPESGAIGRRAGNGAILAWGHTVPNAVAGYAPGCIFIHTDGATSVTLMYVNTGTVASCTFSAQAENTTVLAELAKITVGAGATLIGIYDVATYTTAANVETALAELFAKLGTQAIAAAASAALAPAISGTIALTIANATETNTLAIPAFAGQRLHISCNTRSGTGTRTITVASAIDQAGHLTIVFDAAGEFISLVGVTVSGALAWRIAGVDGATPT
jgi:hypothetical protein